MGGSVNMSNTKKKANSQSNKKYYDFSLFSATRIITATSNIKWTAEDR